MSDMMIGDVQSASDVGDLGVNECTADVQGIVFKTLLRSKIGNGVGSDESARREVSC